MCVTIYRYKTIYRNIFQKHIFIINILFILWYENGFKRVLHIKLKNKNKWAFYKYPTMSLLFKLTSAWVTVCYGLSIVFSYIIINHIRVGGDWQPVKCQLYPGRDQGFWAKVLGTLSHTDVVILPSFSYFNVCNAVFFFLSPQSFPPFLYPVLCKTKKPYSPQVLFNLSETDQSDTDSISLLFLFVSLLFPCIFFHHPLTLSP